MKTKEWLAFIGLSLAWGSSFLWIKIALVELGPFYLVAFRLLIGFLGLLGITLLQRPEWPRSARVWLPLAVMGLINVAIPFTLISWGEVYIDSAITSILNSTVPLFTVLIAHLFLADDRMTWRKGGGLVLGFAGVLVLALRDVQGELQVNLLGQLAILLAALFYGASAVFGRRFAGGAPPVLAALAQLLVATTTMFIAAPLVEGPLVLPDLPTTWVALIWLGLIGSCLAYLMYFFLLRSIGASRMAMVAYTFPVVGVTLGVLFLGERLDAYMVLGAGLVLGSVWVVNRK